MTKLIWDGLTQDQLLVQHQALKDQIEIFKKQEMELRKYIVERAFPDRSEGVNKIDLGNGYELKADVNFNYNIDKPANEVWQALERIRKIGNYGATIADKLVSWKANFLLKEYRGLVKAKDESQEAQAILKEISSFLTIKEAAPELDIKGPKK